RALQSAKSAPAGILRDGRGGARTALPSSLDASRFHRHLGDGGAARGRKLGKAAGEVTQMQVQLIERKAEREDALHRLVRQFPRQPLASQRGDFGGVAVERGFDVVERRRFLTRG